MKSALAKQEQVKHFIAMICELDVVVEQNEIHIIDCGCGKAYLSFALYEYLQHELNKTVHLTGLDTNRDVVRYCTDEASKRGYSNARFMQTPIRSYQHTERADVVLALHACDTATDDALALGILLSAPAILAAPCCHHYVNARLKRSTSPKVMSSLLRDGISRERFADVLTDSMRTQILRAYGYTTDMIEFVAQEHTSKNILIRAQKSSNVVPDETILTTLRSQRTLWNAAPKLAEYMNV